MVGITFMVFITFMGDTGVFLYTLPIWVCTWLLQINKFFEWKLSGSKCCNVKAPFAGNGKGNASHDSYLRSDWVLFSMLDYLAHMAQVQDIANGEMLR